MSDDTDRTGEPSSAGYEGPGAWGFWALALLTVLFVLATGATVHSIIVTLGM